MDFRSLFLGLLIGAVIALIADAAFLLQSLRKRGSVGKRFEEAENALREAKIENLSLRDQLRQLESKHALLASAEPQPDQLAAFESQIQELTAERDRIAGEAEFLRSSLAEAEATPTPNPEELEALQSQYAQSLKSLTAEKEARANLQVQLDELKSALAARQEVAPVANFRNSDEWVTMNHQIQEAQLELEVLRKANKQLREQAEQQETMAPAVAPSTSQAELTELRNAVLKLNKENQELKSRLSSSSEVLDLQAKLDAAQARIRSLEDHSEGPALKDRLATLSRESASLKQSLASAYAQVESLKHKVASLNRDDFSRIPALNREDAQSLSDAGILTYRDLSEAPMERILDILNWTEESVSTVSDWQAAARRMVEAQA